MIRDRCPHPLDKRILWSWDYNRATCVHCGQGIIKLVDNTGAAPVLRFKAIITITEWP